MEIRVLRVLEYVFTDQDSYEHHRKYWKNDGDHIIGDTVILRVATLPPELFDSASKSD